jgi:hypothetical protein
MSFMIAVNLIVLLAVTIAITSSFQKAIAIVGQSTGAGAGREAPIAISGDSV